MRKVISFCGYVLFALVTLLPLGKILASCFDCRFVLNSYPVMASITALVAFCTMVISMIVMHPVASKPAQILLILASPLSLINALFFVVASPSLWVIFCMLICTGCCFCIAFLQDERIAFRILSLFLSVALIIPVCYFGLMFTLFGSIGKDTVVQSVESPGKTYYAQVINSDQGALGGNTLVTVCRSKHLDVLIFQISKKPQILYRGRWGEHKTMKVIRKDETHLIINGIEYSL